MGNKDLKKLSRADLLEMLIEQSKEVNVLRERLDAAEKALEQKEIQISNSGSIAEAALRINGVFEAAEAASRQYLDNVRMNCEKQDTMQKNIDAIKSRLEEAVERTVSETRQRCKVMEEDTKRRCKAMEEDTKRRCKEILLKASTASEKYTRNLCRKNDK